MPIFKDFNLRSVRESDLEVLLKWRNSERIRANMYTDHIITIDEHIRWYESLKKDNVLMPMVFEYKEKPLGVVKLSQYDQINNKCHWGFYLGEVDVPPKSGKKMGYLSLNYIFGDLGIRKLCGEAFAFNYASLKYHKQLGFLEEGRFIKHIIKNGQYQDVVSFAIFKDMWFSIKDDIYSSCMGGVADE